MVRSDYRGKPQAIASSLLRRARAHAELMRDARRGADLGDACVPSFGDQHRQNAVPRCSPDRRVARLADLAPVIMPPPARTARGDQQSTQWRSRSAIWSRSDWTALYAAARRAARRTAARSRAQSWAMACGRRRGIRCAQVSGMIWKIRHSRPRRDDQRQARRQRFHATAEGFAFIRGSKVATAISSCQPRPARSAGTCGCGSAPPTGLRRGARRSSSIRIRSMFARGQAVAPRRSPCPIAATVPRSVPSSRWRWAGRIAPAGRRAGWSRAEAGEKARVDQRDARGRTDVAVA